MFQARLLADIALMVVVSYVAAFGAWAAGERVLGLQGGSEAASYNLDPWTDWDRSEAIRFDDIKNDFRPESDYQIRKWWVTQEVRSMSTIAAPSIVGPPRAEGNVLVRIPVTIPGGFS